MKRHVKFPSIEQFRNVIRTVNSRAEYEGKDEEGNPIYNTLKPKPVLTFTGTVKLHGTNAGVSYNQIDGIWYQSRENIITPQKDNAGFAISCHSKEEVLIDLIKQVAVNNNVDLNTNTITIYFEWIGKGIQKGVAVSELEKCAVVIGCKVTPFDEEISAYWIKHRSIRSVENRIFNILDFPFYNISVDFNNPLLSQNHIIDLTIQVEEECPFSKVFGISGIGEGIVFSCEYQGDRLLFKSKGEKRQINLVTSIAEKVTPEWRLQQGITEVFNTLNGGEIEINKTGDYIRWIINDITKEDLDIIAESGLSLKDIGKEVSDISKNYLFKQL